MLSSRYIVMSRMKNPMIESFMTALDITAARYLSDVDGMNHELAITQSYLDVTARLEVWSSHLLHHRSLTRHETGNAHFRLSL